MKLLKHWLDNEHHNPLLGAKDFVKYIGPGLLVTVGFIDPGNWASNLAAGSDYGYQLLWTVTFATFMLFVLQHNAAHLGIVTGDCLAEAASKHLKPFLSKSILLTAVLATISTAFAEILGGAIALNLLFKVPVKIGAVPILIVVLWLLFSNSYRRIEKWIIGFVSIIGFSFVVELSFVHVSWAEAAKGWFTVSFPSGSHLIILSILGAVIMPTNLFLHSETIQSRAWHKEDPEFIQRQLKYEFTDTLFSMIMGWAINSALLILAAATFYNHQIQVTELSEAKHLMEPLLGNSAGVIFAVALLFSSISSSLTAGMAGGTIVAGMFKEPYDIQDSHTKLGVGLILILSTLGVFFISDPFLGLIYSQMFLCLQLPITIFLQIFLTSSSKVMGQYKNTFSTKILLAIIGVFVTFLDFLLFYSYWL